MKIPLESRANAGGQGIFPQGSLAQDAGGFQQRKGMPPANTTQTQECGLLSLLSLRAMRNNSMGLQTHDPRSKPLRAVGMRELPGPSSTVPTARRLLGNRIMGLNPHAGVAHCLQQILSANPVMKPAFQIDTDHMKNTEKNHTPSTPPRPSKKKRRARRHPALGRKRFLSVCGAAE